MKPDRAEDREKHKERNLKEFEKSSWQTENDVLEYQSSLRATETNETVPCKLNNVKTNYNTLDNYNGLFKRF